MHQSVQMHADNLIHDLFENGGISIVVVCSVICCVYGYNFLRGVAR